MSQIELNKVEKNRELVLEAFDRLFNQRDYIAAEHYWSPKYIQHSAHIPPGSHQVRIKVQACGICHSDSVTREGLLPGIEYPRVPGHEIVGVIDAIGNDVTEWKTGQRVGVGWHGGHCGHCEFCRRGDFVYCQFAQVPGISYD